MCFVLVVFVIGVLFGWCWVVLLLSIDGGVMFELVGIMVLFVIMGFMVMVLFIGLLMLIDWVVSVEVELVGVWMVLGDVDDILLCVGVNWVIIGDELI